MPYQDLSVGLNQSDEPGGFFSGIAGLFGGGVSNGSGAAGTFETIGAGQAPNLPDQQLAGPEIGLFNTPLGPVTIDGDGAAQILKAAALVAVGYFAIRMVLK